jgi:glycolate oxidase FAD binding subunit
MQSTQTDVLAERVLDAYHTGQSLNLTGASSKSFYGGPQNGAAFSIKDYQGILDYDPAELVIVARAGTTLSEIYQTLTDNNQMLGFEPPFANLSATLGGAVASGLSGAGRSYRGGVRDYLLGTKIINGRGQINQFGGRVMKNVAGFDLFRPMAGAMGTLGLLLEISLRVIPIPDYEMSLELKIQDDADYIKALCDMGKDLSSLSAAGYHRNKLLVRLSGSKQAVKRDHDLLDKIYLSKETNPDYWAQLSNFEHVYFQKPDTKTIVAALDMAPATPHLDLPGEQLIDWGGARRYLKTSLDIDVVRRAVEMHGGSATLLRGGERTDFFHPLSPALMAVHHRLKQAFDPKGILNPGRLYTGL